jgi:2-polyprenyl-3-methyl-5-hydroxy-6-metoxy-1,4-benzoquinol methylase
MRKCCPMRNTGFWLVAGAVGYLYWLGKHERPAMRQPSAVAAIDAPELVQAWSTVSQWPQFQLMRCKLMRRAVMGLVGARVLDVGSGLGELTISLAQQPEVSEATGIDLSADFVEQARHQAEILGANARFLEMDAADLSPIPDASFDVVVSTLSLHHWAEPQKALAEIKRVLTPGGRAFIMDLRRDIAAPLLGIATLLSRYILPEPIRRTGEPLASLKAAFTPAEVAVLAVKAGWENPVVTTGPVWMVLEMG